MKIEKSQIHFGMVAIEKGFVTADQVLRVLDKQIEEDSSKGSHKWIGTLLLEEGAITSVQLEEVLQTLKQ